PRPCWTRRPGGRGRPSTAVRSRLPLPAIALCCTLRTAETLTARPIVPVLIVSSAPCIPVIRSADERCTQHHDRNPATAARVEVRATADGPDHPPAGGDRAGRAGPGVGHRHRGDRLPAFR